VGLGEIRWLEIALDLAFVAVGILPLRERLKQLFGKGPRHLDATRSNLLVRVVADILVLLPFGLILGFLPGFDTAPWLLFKLLALPRILNVRETIDSIEGLNPILSRLVPFLVIVPVLVHLCACGWIFFGSGTAEPSNDFFIVYVRAAYWAVSTLFTVGYGDISARTPIQMAFAASVTICGVIFFGYVISNVASLVARLDQAREHHLASLDSVEAFMWTNDIPQETRLRVRAYYRYLWLSRKGTSATEAVAHLPPGLRAEIARHLNAEVVQKVPMFRDADPEFLEEILVRLANQVAVPGERLFATGEAGDAMYFIHRGEVDIVARDGRVVVTLREGAFFGEMALLLDAPRAASAVARSFCDLFVLGRPAFRAVVHRHPSFERILKSHVEALQKVGMADAGPEQPVTGRTLI
jgi:voltage-gated potassium channel